MSVELRLTSDGVDCEFGRVEYGNPRPDRNEVGHLMLTTHDYFIGLFKNGPSHYHGALHSVDAVPQDEEPTEVRLYAFIDYQGKRWAWELFEAHWSDGAGPEMYIGRWPD